MEFTLFLRIFSHFKIIKIVTHLEVMVQNVKKAKSDRSLGSDRSYSLSDIKLCNLLQIFTLQCFVNLNYESGLYRFFSQKSLDPDLELIISDSDSDPTAKGSKLCEALCTGNCCGSFLKIK